MGPRLDSRGNLSHRRLRDALDVASMGPRLDSRGNRVEPVGHNPAIQRASMGPRLDSRGNAGLICRRERHEPGFNGAAT